MVSRCCKTDVTSHGDYYTCFRCNKPCDMILNKPVKRNWLNDHRNESRSESEIEGSFNQT